MQLFAKGDAIQERFECVGVSIFSQSTAISFFPCLLENHINFLPGPEALLAEVTMPSNTNAAMFFCIAISIVS